MFDVFVRYNVSIRKGASSADLEA